MSHARMLAAAAAMMTVAAPAEAGVAPEKSTAAAKTAAKAKAAPNVDPAVAMAMMTKFFDRLFPAGPEPDPARLAAARDMTMMMFPKGAYGEAMSGFVDRMSDQVLSLSEADFAEMMPPKAAEKGKVAKVPSKIPMRQMLAQKEPNFEAKLAAGKAFAKSIFTRFGDAAEPKFREGMARAMARRFDAAQMADIQRFLATPTGAAYGRQMVGLWFEPDVMRGTFQAFPEIMKMMPALAKDAAALDAQMQSGRKKD